jgi:MYXO-CTERM domain-containing protein
MHRLVDAEDHVPVAGIMELRHGAFDSLARGAELLGTTQDALRSDTWEGTRAGIAVLAELGRHTGATVSNLPSWHSAVENLSGHTTAAQREDYARRVFARLASGGSWPTADGEVVRLAPHNVGTLQLETPAVTAQGLNPEFPGATWFETPQANKWTSGRSAPADRIVIHDTEGGWDASVATLQNDTGKSVHYLIDADGSRVGQFITEADTGWHAGNWYWNVRSVGIEHVGYASSTFQRALYDKSVQLVNSIRSRHNVPLDRQHIVGHYQIPNGNNIAQESPACPDGLSACENDVNYGGSNHHTDPGFNWQWCQYMQLLGGTCACNDAWALFNCTTDHTQAWRCNNGALEGVDCTGGCTVMPLGVADVCTTAAGSSSSAATSHATSAAPSSSRAASSSAQGSSASGSSMDPPPSSTTSTSSVSAGSTDGLVQTGKGEGGYPQVSARPGCNCAAGQAPAGGGALLGLVMLLRWRRQPRSSTPLR